MVNFKPQKIFIFLINVCCFSATVFLFNSCATAKNKNEYIPDTEGWYSLKDMSEAQFEKLLEELMENRNLSEEEMDEFRKRQKEGYSVRFFENGSLSWVAPARYERFDVVCIIQKVISPGISTLNKDSLVIISPNPTSSQATVKLIPQLSKLYNNRNLFPISVEFQLLYNQRIIHQWTNHHCNETETIPAEYLKANGTYALVVKFLGPTGCSATAVASFMVVGK